MLRRSRAILGVFAVLTAVATNQLFLFSARTMTGFAWTIQVPLSAAFVGAGYAAGCVLVVLGYRSRGWLEARLSMVTVWIFATLTLVATLEHLYTFHFHAPGFVPRFAAWFWLGIYVAVPIVLASAIIGQMRSPGHSGPQREPLPRWLAAVLGTQGLIIVSAGVALFIDPVGAAGDWPWPLTPLTAQMVAAWLVAFGVAALLAVVERDLQRLRASAVGYTVFGVLQLVAVLRFRDEIHWHQITAWIYLLVLASVSLAGVAGWLLAQNVASHVPAKR